MSPELYVPVPKTGSRKLVPKQSTESDEILLKSTSALEEQEQERERAVN
jgi:hypothetical protein